MSKVLFTDLSLSREVLKSIEEMGFEVATAIQGEAIPPIIEGRDVIGQSRTGTGKTVAFAVPAVEKVDPAKLAVQALILCPTRELCIQVAEQVGKLAKHRKGLHALPIYGGQSYDRQLDGLRRGAQIVIGTPGRLIDHLDRGRLKLDQVKLVILDEADEMLDMGFQEDIEHILEKVPTDRQTVLFSATMQPGIRRLASKFLTDPLTIKASTETLSVPAIDQAFMEVRGPMKLEALTRVLDFHRVKLGIIFCNTRLGVDELVEHLQARGYLAEGLHGEHKQTQRDRIMTKFRNRQVELLVATDVASRGIDVKDVEIVVNFDLPKDEEDYVHRIGRTGRAGKSGLALSFASGRDLFRLRNVERFTKTKIPRRQVPTLDQVESSQHSVVLDKVREVLSQGGLEKFMPLVDALTEGDTNISDVACALLKMTLPETSARDVEVEDKPRYEHTGKYERGEPRERYPREKGGRFDRDSGPRGERPARMERAHGFEDGSPSAQIFLNIGKAKGVKPKDIVGALAGETGLPGKTFGAIDLFPNHTLVQVPEGKIDEVLGLFQNVRIKGTPVKARRAT
jgi:ATP-dependent RNA helicase DeaD